MTRKQARRRAPSKRRQVRLPKIALTRVVVVLVALAVVGVTYQFSASMLDRPIRSVEISGPFQRVTALQIEEAISDDLAYGFLSADLSDMQEKITALAWIDHASVARRWPSRIVVNVTEQIPAACWGERGLLNTRGELFVTDAKHIPAELPRLSGPEDQASDVAKRYLEVREQLIPLGLDVRELTVDKRGSWDMTLQNGIEIRLGRQDVAARTSLFLDIVANIVSSREADIDFVDMRYSNGFTIGWAHESRSPIVDPGSGDQQMVAERMSR